MAPGDALALALAFALPLVFVLPGAAHGAPLTVTVVEASGQPLADAVVAVLVKGGHTVATAGESAQVGQKSRQFQPQLTVIQTGTSVTFPNYDSVRHHVYSFSPIKKFELKLYAGTPAAPVVFDKPGVATLGCNIHDRMSAYVVVVDTPLYARTDAAGHATLDVSDGDHRLLAWHARLADPLVLVESPLKVSPASGGQARVQLTVGPAPKADDAAGGTVR